MRTCTLYCDPCITPCAHTQTCRSVQGGPIGPALYARLDNSCMCHPVLAPPGTSPPLACVLRAACWVWRPAAGSHPAAPPGDTCAYMCACTPLCRVRPRPATSRWTPGQGLALPSGATITGSRPWGCPPCPQFSAPGAVCPSRCLVPGLPVGMRGLQGRVLLIRR